MKVVNHWNHQQRFRFWSNDFQKHSIDTLQHSWLDGPSTFGHRDYLRQHVFNQTHPTNVVNTKNCYALRIILWHDLCDKFIDIIIITCNKQQAGQMSSHFTPVDSHQQCHTDWATDFITQPSWLNTFLDWSEPDICYNLVVVLSQPFSKWQVMMVWHRISDKNGQKQQTNTFWHSRNKMCIKNQPRVWNVLTNLLQISRNDRHISTDQK